VAVLSGGMSPGVARALARLAPWRSCAPKMDSGHAGVLPSRRCERCPAPRWATRTRPTRARKAPEAR